MHCPNTWRAEPQRKISFPFSRKISPPPNQKSKRHFSFGVAGVLASAWGFLRIICFENRFELGTINTPKWNLAVENQPRSGRAVGTPTLFRLIFQTNLERTSKLKINVYYRA